VLSNHESELESISCGVPQGSALDPLLFLIYINDIQYVNSSNYTKVKLFADDSHLFLHNRDPAQLFHLANTCTAYNR